MTETAQLAIDPCGERALARGAQNYGVAFLPGRYFEVVRRDPGGLRLSFAGLTTGEIRRGLEILGQVIAGEWERISENREPAPAMV